MDIKVIKVLSWGWQIMGEILKNWNEKHSLFTLYEVAGIMECTENMFVSIFKDKDFAKLTNLIDANILVIAIAIFLSDYEVNSEEIGLFIKKQNKLKTAE